MSRNLSQRHIADVFIGRERRGIADELIAAAHRAQADALEIEALAKRRLADEYDAAQGRGEVATGRPKSLPGGNTSSTVVDLGLTSKQVHEARRLRDAEKAEPGVIRKTLDERLAQGAESSLGQLCDRQATADVLPLFHRQRPSHPGRQMRQRRTAHLLPVSCHADRLPHRPPAAPRGRRRAGHLRHVPRRRPGACLGDRLTPAGAQDWISSRNA